MIVSGWTDGIPHFGLVAEEVERVNPDLVVRGEDAKVMTVRYEAVNAMLLNELLKEHRKVEEQDYKLKEQEATPNESEPLLVFRVVTRFSHKCVIKRVATCNVAE